MKNIFEDQLKLYNKLPQQTPEMTENEQLDTELSLSFYIDKAADNFQTEKTDQAQIHQLQLKKQVIMGALKQSLANLDNPTAVEANLLPARQIALIDDQYRWKIGKEERPVSLGEIMTDGDWGINYHLDPASVPRNVRKQFLVETARRELGSCLDEQICINEMSSALVDDKKQQAYHRIYEEHQAGKIDRHTGLIAERMVCNFLKKITYDFEVDFKINHADAYQDVNQKIDFIISRQTHKRGVRVETEEQKTMGIQFTINSDQAVTEHKEQQVSRANRKLTSQDHIDSIVLVSLPMENIRKNFEAWQKTRAAGGPDKLWSSAEKQTVFRGVMAGFLTEAELLDYESKL